MFKQELARRLGNLRNNIGTLYIKQLKNYVERISKETEFDQGRIAFICSIAFSMKYKLYNVQKSVLTCNSDAMRSFSPSLFEEVCHLLYFSETFS